MNERDFPLVRGGKLPKEALPWLKEVERFFPGATKDIVIVRKPTSPSPRETKIGNQQRERKLAK
jgi:hypothetical protein